MNTTLVFAELLTSGLLATFGIVLALLGIGFDPKWLTLLSPQTQAIVTVVGVAVVYALGVIVDGMADKALSKVGENWKMAYKIEPQHSLISLSLSDRSTDFFEKFLEYIRIRIRIVRSFIFNACFIIPFGLWAGSTLKVEWLWYAVWVFLWGVCVFAAYLQLRQLQKAWYQNLGIAWGVWGVPPDKIPSGLTLRSRGTGQKRRSLSTSR
jgi:hypothetical protein